MQTKVKAELIPWFMHSFINPPTDTLTLHLLAAVEDLPAIPGPKTLGTENYSRILDAFSERGWAAFEEEFERIIPRDRTEYAEIKRDLLCEPVFRIKVHRRLTDLVLGNRTTEEVFQEIGDQAKPSGDDDKPLMWRE